MRLGVAPTTELRLALPDYLKPVRSSTAPGGVGDLSAGFKRQIGPLAGDFELSVIAAACLLTGHGPLSSHCFDPFIKFPWSIDLTENWSIGGMESAFWTTDTFGRNTIAESTFYLERQITKRFDAFVEYVGNYVQHGTPQQLVHCGGSYRLSALSLIDFHLGFGVSEAAPDILFGIGYSFRFDRLW